jgi:hypothetical protein
LGAETTALVLLRPFKALRLDETGCFLFFDCAWLTEFFDATLLLAAVSAMSESGGATNSARGGVG